MSRRWAGALIALAALVLVAVGWSLWRGAPPRAAPAAADAAPVGGVAPAAGPAAEGAAAPEAESRESFAARLYYPTASDRLLAEERQIESGDAPELRAAALVTALVSTPPAPPRVPLFATPVTVGRTLLLADGTLVLDLHAAESEDPPASGSTVEMLRVYSVVHTLLRNVAEAQQVVLLWNGRQRASFSGHVDTARPLRLRPELEAPVAAAAPVPAPAGTAAPAAEPAPERH